MSTLTKLALGMMGKVRPKPAIGDAAPRIALPVPQKDGGMPLMEALARRHSAREFASSELPLSVLSDLLWAANGVNRPEGGRTAPSALNAQEIDLYLRFPLGPIFMIPTSMRCGWCAGPTCAALLVIRISSTKLPWTWCSSPTTAV